MKKLISFRILPALLVLFVNTAGARAGTVSREAPPLYKKVIEGELTPIEPLLEEIDYFSPEESDHGCVLQETIVYIDSDGRTYEVFHNAYKALSNGDLDDVGSDLFSYRPETDKIHLVKAETILPDGTIREVPPEGIMIQAHQQDQDSMIFSGREQLRLVYPQITKGSVTHFIVVLEHESSRIPGHYVDWFSWARSWQEHLKHVVLNVSPEYAARLKYVALGDGIPDPVITELDAGRMRYEWVRKKLPVRKWEYLGGPVVQTGPMLFLSTLRDWDELAEWYSERILESSELNDAVKAVAQEWAGEAESEDEIIHNLAFRVANDIRYVSLEFGVGGLQPQPVSSVLENRFGDCKDKANFLRVLLQEHGIKSYVALINTKHAGHVEKRSADYNYFNHAILLIEKANGEKLFCDPTIKYGSAGMIYPSIANRSALVFDHTTATGRWVQTPQASAGNLDYGLDLKISPSGELSGWLTLEAKGYYASSLSRRFEATERDSLKYEVEKYVGYFYDASTVIDYEIERAAPDKQEFHLKTYFIRPATGQATLSVSWPTIKWLLPRLGEEKDVLREAFVWNDSAKVSLKLALPEGTVLAGVPADWRISSPGFSAEGNWSSQDDGLLAEWNANVSRSHYSPPEFPKLFNAVDATRHWLEEPVILGTGDEQADQKVAASSTGELGDEFMLMSTGEGQVNLVDHLYPSDTRAQERRVALERTKVWFPKDQKTQFECDTRIGWLAYSAERYEESLKIAQDTFRNYGDAVDRSERGWVRYLEALSLEEVGRVEESKQLLLELASDSEMNEYRRGFSSYQYARIMSDTNAAVACEYFLKALEFDTQNERWMLEKSYSFLLENMQPEDLVRHFKEMHDIEPEKAASITTWLGELGTENAKFMLGLVRAEKIYKVLSALEFSRTAMEPQQFETLAELAQEFNGYAEGRSALKRYLEENNYTFWDAEPDRERDFDGYNEDIDQAIEEDDIESSARMALWRILYLEPEVEFPAWVWHAARMVEYLYNNDQTELEPLLVFILDMRQYLPEDKDGTLDLQFIRAKYLNRKGGLEEANAVFQMLHDQELEQRWWNALYSRWTEMLLASGQSDKALEVYGIAKSKLKDDEDFLPFCIQGMYMLFESGRSDEALSWIHEVYEVCSVQGWEGALVDHLTGWIDLEDAGLLEDFSTFNEQWWPQWKQAQQAVGLSTNPVAYPVTFTDLEDAGRNLGYAISGEDLERVSEIMERILVGAKWHPALCLEAQSLVSFLVQHYPDAEADLYDSVITLNSGAFQLNPTNCYSARINALDALLKSKRYEELMALAERCYNDDQHEVYRNMYARYGALGAINLSLPATEWMGRMAPQLEDPESKNDPYVVNIISLLYRLEDRTQDELELLKEFVTNYDGENEQMQSMLKSRHTQLESQMESNKQLTLALNEWVDAHGPAWLFCFPDPGVGKEDVAEISRTIQEILGRDDSSTYHDAVYLLYAALEERLDSSMREEAFSEFLSSAMGPLWDTRRHLDMLDSIIGDERFSESLRNLCASFAVNVAVTSHMPGYLETRLLSDMEGLDVFKEIADNKDSLKTLCDLDGFSGQELSGWMDSIREAGKPIGGRTTFLLGGCFHDLCRIGEVELARRQIANARKLRFDSSSNGSAFSLQLEWQQKLDLVEDMIPLHDVMQSFFMEKLKPDCEKPNYADTIFGRELDLGKRRSINRALLQYRLYEHLSLEFWSELNDTEYLNGNICVDAANLGLLCDEVLAVCNSDQQYSMAVYLIRMLFDSDDPACQEIYNAKTAELSRNPDLRYTHQELLFTSYHQRIRAGKHDRLLVDLRSEKNLSKAQTHSLMMNLLLVSEDKEAMGSYLNTASPELLLEDMNIGDTLKAYTMCGRESSFELLRERGEEVLREFMADAVLLGDRGSLYHALQLSDLLGSVDSLTTDWVDKVRKTAQKDDFVYLQMRLSDLREDWSATENAAGTLTGLAPFHYDTYFYLGKALIKQGRNVEGVKALEPFLRYCKDSVNYRIAEQMAGEIKPKT